MKNETDIVFSRAEIKFANSNSITVDPHTHNFLELAYVTRGRAEHEIDGRKSIIERGDYFFVDYNTSHCYESIGGRPFNVINLLFRPVFIDKSLSHCRSFNGLLSHYLIKITQKNLTINPANSIFHDSGGTILQILNKMQTEYENKKIGWQEIMRSYLIELIVLTARSVANAYTNDDDFLNRMLHLIDKRFSEKLTLSDIASELNYSVPYLSLKFKEETGIGFKKMLEKKRIDEACRLLANSSMKIPEIAEMVGYTDVNFFYSVFKKHMGQTPFQMRKSCK